MPTNEGAFLVKEYPLENSPNKSVSKVCFYFYPEVLEYIKNLEKLKLIQKLTKKN